MEPLRDAHFQAVKNGTKDMIESNPTIRRFTNSLVGHLNGVLPHLQAVRQEVSKSGTTLGRDAFTRRLWTMDQHWYVYNVGGREEVQYNAGMTPDWFRIGLGLFLEPSQWVPDPSGALRHYRALRDVLVDRKEDFDLLVDKHKLKVEWQSFSGDMDIERNAREVTTTLIDGRDDLLWIFVGRILERNSEEDLEILSDGSSLGSVITTTCEALWPYYEKTMKRPVSIRL